MNGATLGAQVIHGLDADGVEFWIDRDRFSGWDDSATSSIAVTEKPRSNGGLAGSAYNQSAHLAIGGYLQAGSDAGVLAARDRLKAACSLDPTVLSMNIDGSVRTMTVRREDAVLFNRTSPTVAEWSVQLVALDPRKYGAALTGTTGLPASTGGMTVPVTVPFTLAETITSGHVTLVNLGNTDAPVTLTLTGPTVGSLVGPIITHFPSGLRLVFDPSRYVPAGESWVIDCENRQVLAGGTSPRTGWLIESGWPVLVPGVNAFGLTAVGSGPDPSLSVASWSAWE